MIPTDTAYANIVDDNDGLDGNSHESRIPDIRTHAARSESARGPDV